MHIVGQNREHRDGFSTEAPSLQSSLAKQAATSQEKAWVGMLTGLLSFSGYVLVKVDTRMQLPMLSHPCHTTLVADSVTLPRLTISH